MKRRLEKLYLRLYRNLSNKLTGFLPKEMEPEVMILPSDKKDQDICVIAIHIPHDLVKKLMWSMKVWRAK